ncbi:hypothetical protein OKA05_16580 [Luteolibacter arcticus]|uniref:Uncharacterized protein n=1 Tax=Luteolibacter arcticus TaxID=1581411 RepID=A0ABT3GKZ8_9BACT|nr:hypothetical protein [Luteolibacter arcticus]MCW1924184.1 hypothetical protein [Luteolibacter arcticus]
MNATEALDNFLRHVLDPRKAERYCDLIQRPKGQKRFLADLYHTVGDCFREDLPNNTLSAVQRSQPGFSFSEVRGFGILEHSIEAAYDALMPDTGWLLIDTRGGVGIYQPEDMIDDQRQIVV